MNPLQETLQNRSRSPLLAVAIQHYHPAFVEMAGYLGVDILWIEMEHAHLTFREAADLCRLAAGAGLLSLVRISDARRENVLKAAESGPDIIDLPMANTPAIAAEFVSHGRYAPQGNRGHYSTSRAVNYGLGKDIVEAQQQANKRLCLMAQIETVEAMEQAEAISQVVGLDALFYGLGDLSASMGVTGQVGHPAVQAAADRGIAIAKASGKAVGVPSPPADAARWRDRGADFILCGSDISCLKTGLQAIIEAARG